MGISKRFGDLTYRLYPHMTVPAGDQLAAAVPRGSVSQLDGVRHCAVVSFRRDGTPVSTPVWFGVRDGRVVFRSLTTGYKLKRIRRDPTVLVAPCTKRGRPLGPPFEGRARILGPEEEAGAERAIQERFGLGRRIYRRTLGDAPAVYVEISPAH